MATTQQRSIRDLIAELAGTEDVLRGGRGAAGPRERSARRRQGEIVTELRSRRGRCALG